MGVAAYQKCFCKEGSLQRDNITISMQYIDPNYIRGRKAFIELICNSSHVSLRSNAFVLSFMIMFFRQSKYIRMHCRPACWNVLLSFFIMLDLRMLKICVSRVAVSVIYKFSDTVVKRY